MPAYEGPDRRSRSNPGLSGDVGELRGVLNTHLAQQMELWSRYHDELRQQRETYEKQLQEIKIKVETVAQWKDQMTGGMKVAAFMWKAWAAGVTVVLGWLSYWRGHP